MESSFVLQNSQRSNHHRVCRSKSSYLQSRRSVSPSAKFLKKKPLQKFLPVIKKVKGQNIEKQLSLYKWRSETDYPFFKIYDYKCRLCKNNTIIELRCQLPNNTLSSINSFSLQNGLYILKTVCFGMKKLIQMFSFFKITEKMIGLTHQNNCKMWINERFEDNIIICAQKSEKEMIKRIEGIVLVKIKCIEDYKNKLKNIMDKAQTFYELEQDIWKFSYNHQILIPPFYQTSDKTVNTSRKQNTLKRNLSKLQISSFKFKQDNLNKSKRKSFYDLQNKHRRYSNLSRIDDSNKTKDTKNLRVNFDIPRSISKKKDVICNRQKCSPNIVAGFNPYTNKLTKSDNYGDDRWKTYPQKQLQILNKSTKSSNTSKSQFFSQLETTRNTQMNSKMGAMRKIIQEKLHKPRKDNFRVVHLDACGTVKSIGQFLQSERDLQREEQQIKILKSMGRQVYESVIDQNQ